MPTFRSASRPRCALAIALLLVATPLALERKDVTFKIFQFAADQIPRVDGKTDDWAMVPESYAVGMGELMDTEQGHGLNHDTKNLDVKVRVGWVKGLNRLYFLYEGFDNYWDFAASGLHNDIFEVVVDGDLSGGPLIDIYHRDVWTPEAVGPRSELDPRVPRADAHFGYHGVHAQNYHIFTPPGDKDWTMAWGCAQARKTFLRERRVRLQLQAGRVGKACPRVLDHAVRLRGLRWAAARD